MKKLALLAVVLAAFCLPLAGASADPVCDVPAGCIAVLEGGYILVLDGAESNPDPGDGFISVSEGGQICSDDNGTADDGDDTNGPESESPMCLP